MTDALQHILAKPWRDVIKNEPLTLAQFLLQPGYRFGVVLANTERLGCLRLLCVDKVGECVLSVGSDDFLDEVALVCVADCFLAVAPNEASKRCGQLDLSERLLVLA
jgi:hypothetical protein